MKGCIVITAGFKEIGGQGVELEEAVKAVAKENGIRLLGPNCLGAANTNQRRANECQLRTHHAPSAATLPLFRSPAPCA